MLHQDRAVLEPAEREGEDPSELQEDCGGAEAGGSPSSEAPPEVAGVGSRQGRKPETEIGAGGHRARKVERSKDRTVQRERGRESGSVLGARNVNRLQKSEKRIFLESASSLGATRDWA